MRKVLKWIGIIMGGLVITLFVVATGLMISTDLRFNRVYTLQAEAVAKPGDTVSLDVGRRWAEMHCQGCHGSDLGGGPLFEDEALGVVDAPNLTTGRGGLGARYQDADWVRAIRHGVRLDGTSVFIMPSNEFYYLSDADLGSLIAYLQTVPAVDRETRTRSLTPLAKLLYAVGAFENLLYAETIAHDERPAAPPAGVTVTYGEYLAHAHGCAGCHGETLAGHQPAEPGAPFAPSLTPGGELGTWSEAEFFAAVRTGVTPAGRRLSEAMPSQYLVQLTDAELSAIWLYLRSLPARAEAP